MVENANASLPLHLQYGSNCAADGEFHNRERPNEVHSTMLELTDEGCSAKTEAE